MHNKGVTQGSGFRQSLFCVAYVQQHKKSSNNASIPNAAQQDSHIIILTYT